MQTRRIGSLTVSVVGLGCNNFGMTIDDARSADVVHAALDAGITFFDTADMYGGTDSERFLGRALGRRRNDAVIATKFGLRVNDDFPGGAKPEYVARACEASLKRLNVDRIDLYQLHKPDPSVSIGDTLAAMNELVTAGKVREIGCSNFSVEQLHEAHAAVKAGAAKFVSVQNEYSLLHRVPEQGILAECARLELAFLPYFPLASGLLTGKYVKGVAPPKGTRMQMSWAASGMTDTRMNAVEKLRAIAEQNGRTLLELAFSWLLRNASVASVIAGATKPEQILANAGAADWTIPADVLADIDRAAPVV
ncbi:MAG TPA: aldo/keto reductase [Vicinamibacterales bacterium]|nr:aldo/keto reductase [Vicinamibacterales bacterium]